MTGENDNSGNPLDKSLADLGPPAGLDRTLDSEPLAPDHGATAEHTPQPQAELPRFAETTDYYRISGPGTVIAGRYTLVEKIGEGGMGEVWVAKQTEPVKRKVALKLIKAGMDSKAVLARFEQERQALALMDHPNIARVLDGGLTPTGQPFFVMELVNGQPLTRFCDESRLTPQARLELFVPICHAVQHAHQKGIVHRDLKPANILVTSIDGKPVPRVIDFGVAKATSGKLTDESLSTHIGAVVGTLEYMSPEQAGYGGEDIDTRADIYSLGVILYELLTGLRPIDARRLKKAALTEMIRIIHEEEPSKPSTRLSTDESFPSLAAVRQTEPKKLMALLRGELDWVVMKCLEKKRDRRYETANGLARDIQRYLADEPVEARPPSFGYRAGKFLRRHKGPVIAASLVFIALVGGILGTTVGLVRAVQAEGREAEQRRQAESERDAKESARADAVAQRDRAAKARDRTRQVLDEMTSQATGDALDRQSALSEEQKGFLTSVLSYYIEFAGEIADDEQTRARTAAAAFRVGMIEYRLGRRDEGAVALAHACDAYTALVADFPTFASYRSELANSHGNRGVALLYLGKREEAIKEFRNTLALKRKLAEEFPALPSHRSGLARTHINLGIVLSDLGRQAEAVAEYRQAQTLVEKLAEEFPAVPDYRFDQAQLYHNLASALRELGEREEAETAYRQALTFREKLAEEFPAEPDYRFHLASTHSGLGRVLDGLGKREEAEAEYRKSLPIQASLATEFPAVVDYRIHLAISHFDLGKLLAGLGKRQEALTEYRQAQALQEKLSAEFPAVPDHQSNLAKTQNTMGVLLQGLGMLSDAESAHRQARAIRERLVAEFPAVPDYRRDLARNATNLAMLLMGLGKSSEAEANLREGLALFDELVAEFPSVPDYRNDLAGNHNNLGLLFLRLGKWMEAEAQYRQSLALQETLVAEFPMVPGYQIVLGGSYCNLGTLQRDDGRPADSLTSFERAITILAPLVEKEPRLVTARQFLQNSHVGRAIAYSAIDQPADGLVDWDRAIALCAPDERASIRVHRATALSQAGRTTEAVAEVADLTKTTNWNANEWYDFACVYALASAKEPANRKEYEARAVELLRQACAKGYKNLDGLTKNPELEPLREREDFQKLVAELQSNLSREEL
jgi:serine/threonine protein kinase/tetratricopeptide (TPR) repeat protein